MARKRGLSTEDQRLWAQVAATAAPLRPQQRLPLASPAAPVVRDLAKPAPEQPRFDVQPFRIGQTAMPRGGNVARAPSPGDALRAAAVRMDGKLHRRMVKGKIAPDARIDLHGMTLALAQPRLAQFILKSHAAGHRLVLVITGKGKPGGSDAPLPVRPGALRHYAPHWLHSPPLSAVVLQVTPAHLRHGGEGAYYVYLRK